MGKFKNLDQEINEKEESQGSENVQVEKAEKKVDVFNEFISKNIHHSLTQAFRNFCAGKTRNGKINFQDKEILEKLRKEFLGIK
ncbi:MAG: hypothetical protein KDK36_11000 [Leptospiraceae bacterium]|nr:hypothetical protein [Leptospiraceae bacterium]